MSSDLPLAGTDYSQHGQALILRQLLTPNTPKVVIDIGAHDGWLGSNSRGLLEDAWRGLLVEPLPAVFSMLRTNCSGFPNATLVQAACSDRQGTARIHIGRDGACGQMSSLSSDPILDPNLTADSVEVPTITMAQLVEDHQIPEDFGVLLVDTEGWDLTVLKSLECCPARPRIIVTEEFDSTNQEKYALLHKCKYRFVGVWGSDSFWVSEHHPVHTTSIQLPIHRLPDTWEPPGESVPGALASIDSDPYARRCLVGWIGNPAAPSVEPGVALAMEKVGSPQTYKFRAWRTPRPDVASYFKTDNLLMAGYRAVIDVPDGEYELRIIQFGSGVYAEAAVGKISIRMSI